METAGAKSTKRQDVRKKRKIIIFAFEICLILVMLGVLWLVMQTPSEGPSRVVIDPGNVAISENIQKEKEEGESPMLGYMNVALFGVDAKTDSQLYKSSRSDSMMIASINLDTGDIKLVSVYRDTLLDLGDLGVYYNEKKEKQHKSNNTLDDLSDDIFQKCNAAYSYGGAELLVETIKQNFGISINRYVLVNFEAFANLVDSVGGVELELTSEEIEYVNGYLVEYNMLLGRPQGTDNMDTSVSGLVHLNGAQALAYIAETAISARTSAGRSARGRC